MQLNYTRSFEGNLTWTNTLNYTRGDGYDEYYKSNKKLKNYGFPSDIEPARSDLIYRKAMDNDYGVAQSTLRYRSTRLDVTGGVNLGGYRGGHWGTVLRTGMTILVPSWTGPSSPGLNTIRWTG